MSNDLTLSASARTHTGRHVRALRREGQVPAVIYGHGVEARSISADARLLERAWQRAGHTHLVDISVDGSRAQKVLFRDVQFDPKTRRALHADFFAVNLREKLTADVPVAVHGSAPAVDDLKVGQLLQPVTSLKVECLPQDLPAQLNIDISELREVGAHITVGDIELPKGVTLVHGDDAEVVVTIAPLRLQTEDELTAAAGEAEAAAAAPAETPAADGDQGAE